MTTFSRSLNSATVPSDWIKANIRPFFSKNKATGTPRKNYSPISLTSIISKCFEIIIKTHIEEHMQNNNLFSHFQYGFIPKRSTTLQLLKVLYEWTKAIDEAYPTSNFQF